MTIYTKTVTTTSISSSTFPYPVGKRKMLSVLKHLKNYQEGLITRRAHQYIADYSFDDPHIEDVTVNSISFHYTPMQNNSHLKKLPLKDRLLEKYQAIDITVELDMILNFNKQLNYIKIKYPQYYDDICSEYFMKGVFSSIIFRSILDSNVDDLF